MAKRKRVTKGQYGDVRLAVEEQLGVWRMTPAETHRWLEDQVREKRPGFTRDRIPTLRTIQNWAAHVRPRDESSSWRLSDRDIDDPSLVLDTLGAVIMATDGRISSFTCREARLIESIARVCPDVVPADRWRLALDYIAREDDNETSDLDAFLALAPWRSYEAEDVYNELVEKGWISPPRGVTIELTAAHPQQPRPREADVEGELNRGAESGQYLDTVSDPVSDDARSVTVRHRTKSPRRSAAQDVTDGSE
jgi:hypothetical protein